MIRAISHVLAAVFSDASEFNRHWTQNDLPASTESGFPRRWEGEWISQSNGHHGALRGVLIEKSPTEYAATFYAVYAGMLRVCYTVPLRGTMNGETLKLEGDAELGRLAGGTYHYAGEATARTFRCTYQCKYDRGTFEMRPVAKTL